MSSTTPSGLKRHHTPSLGDLEQSSKKVKKAHAPGSSSRDITMPAATAPRVDSVEPLESPQKSSSSMVATAAVIKAVSTTSTSSNATGIVSGNELDRSQNASPKAQVQGDEQRPNTPRSQGESAEMQKRSKTAVDGFTASEQGKPTTPSSADCEQTFQDPEEEMAFQQDIIKNYAAIIETLQAEQQDYKDTFGAKSVKEIDSLLRLKHEQLRRRDATITELEKHTKRQLEDASIQKQFTDEYLKHRDAEIRQLAGQKRATEFLVELKNTELKQTEEELKKTKQKLSNMIAANTDLEKSATILYKSKNTYKKTVNALEDSSKLMRAELKKKDFQLKSIGERCAKRVSYIAQTKAVLRENEIPLPKPDMEFLGWDDKKNAKEAVDAFFGR